MKNLKRTVLMILALMTAICLSIAAFAEDAAETPAETVLAAETASVDAAQASADALNEALAAYSSAKAESRNREYLDSLKQELDGFVEAGKLTRDQADLILKYYTEQVTLRQNGPDGGIGGRGGRGSGFGNGRNGRNGMGFGGGKGGRFGQRPDAVQNAPVDPGESAPEGSGM